MYKLYVDRNENFECDVSVKNASLKGSKARLVMESMDGTSLIFNGKIENGKCIVPIRRLKGLFENNERGKISLEVIVEDTYFQPWQSEFLVEQHKDVKVVVNENRQPTKPMVEVNVTSQQDDKIIALYEISKLCERFGIRKLNLCRRKNDFKQLILEYFSSNPEYISNKEGVLENLKHFLK